MPDLVTTGLSAAGGSIFAGGVGYGLLKGVVKSLQRRVGKVEETTQDLVKGVTTHTANAAETFRRLERIEANLIELTKGINSTLMRRRDGE